MEGFGNTATAVANWAARQIVGANITMRTDVLSALADAKDE